MLVIVLVGSMGLRTGLTEKPEVVTLEFESVLRYLLSKRSEGLWMGERRPPGR